MSNITTELSSSKRKKEANFTADSVIRDVKLLEASDAQDDLRIANALGNKHSIAIAQKQMGKMLELEKLDKRYAGNIYTIDQIKSLARKYNMRFLQSKYFCGNLDLGVISKIKAFSKETGVEITDANLQYNFYILAPENSFRLTEVTVRRPSMDKDPAIFYKVDDSHYRLIHQWGSDFTILNRIAGLNWQSRTSKWSLHFFSMLACSIVLCMILHEHASSWIFIVGIILCIVLTLLWPGFLVSKEGTHDNEYHERKWRSTDFTKYE